MEANTIGIKSQPDGLDFYYGNRSHGMKMVDFLQGHILLAYRNSIIYLNVSEFGIDEEELKISDKILRGQD